MSREQVRSVNSAEVRNLASSFRRSTGRLPLNPRPPIDCIELIKIRIERRYVAALDESRANEPASFSKRTQGKEVMSRAYTIRFSVRTAGQRHGADQDRAATCNQEHRPKWSFQPSGVVLSPFRRVHAYLRSSVLNPAFTVSSDGGRRMSASTPRSARWIGIVFTHMKF